MAYAWLFLTLALLAGSSIRPARGQSSPPVVGFEVASVKTDTSGAGASIAFTPGRVTARGIVLEILIMNAFNVRSFQLQGGPRWIGSDRFEVDAKWPTNANPKQAPEMLQALLAERFKLK